MTKSQILSKFEYHSALAMEAASWDNEADCILEDARAELALWHLMRL